MTDAEQREAARQFVNKWQKGGDEIRDCHPFWIELLHNVLGVENATDYISFEKPVKLPEGDGKIHSRRIDGYIPSVKVLIEQKGSSHPLDEKEPQSGGELLTPYEQAKRYNDNLPFDEKARWIVTSNFISIWVYDMNATIPEPVKIELIELQNKYPLLDFLVKKEVKNISHEMEISIKAGDIVGKLYDALIKQYKDPTNEHSLKSLNALCVRIVFCLYAEDAGIFGERAMFHDYLQSFRTDRMRNALIDLFRVLDQKPEERDPYLEPELAAFPYVNGGLFSDENIEIPMFTDEIRELLLVEASENFNWSDISPTIFGAVFESTLNPETRRSGGMHYTSIENIHKVIDPLFLDDLKAELTDIEKIQIKSTRNRKLHQFQDKLASLEFLDPAAGSGNFLTETYLSLRRLENKVVRDLTGGQMVLGDVLDPIKVSITQFHGIEINDFAVTVAKTALWIAESQMMKETENIIVQHLDFLPLTTNANIVEGNALQIDWNEVVPAEKLNYIMGNPPFVGQQHKTKDQSFDMRLVFGKGAPETKLDYVTAWYQKAINYMNAVPGRIRAAYVSTNSICQGESVPTFWKRMSENDTTIIFARTSFKWTSESKNVAGVVCVIVGFTNGKYDGPKYLFEDDQVKTVKEINAYLKDAPDLWIISRVNKPHGGFPKMIKGSEPTDGGNLFFSEKEAKIFVSKYPRTECYIKPFVGGDEYLNNPQGIYSRYCIWLNNGNPMVFKGIKEIEERFERIRKKRLSSSADRIRKRADYPYLFCQIRQPSENFLLLPRHSSADRRYIPIGFISSNVIAGDACYIIPDAGLYLFGLLTSNVHMAWTRVVCGRLGEGYRYSPAIYNNFPWPTPTDEQKARIEQTAQGILDARALYPDSSLADLYDPLTMPPELRKAHTANDIAVMKAYGFSTTMSEADCVAELMKMYQKLTADEKTSE